MILLVTVVVLLVVAGVLIGASHRRSGGACEGSMTLEERGRGLAISEKQRAVYQQLHSQRL